MSLALSIREIARRTGLPRNTIRKYFQSNASMGR
ncbi:helix-turn-helix domain-containing protein [Kordiimonas lipolytica]|uniref:Helix-turn-helix domain-containing protein n=1 Tax=Kordiimonas lipolytica TaxID=1662421 RepID=A0ABV8UEZ5_9PROT